MRTKEKVKKRWLEHWQIVALYLVIYDLCAVNGAYFLALWLRFDLRFSAMPDYYLETWLQFAPIYTVFCLLVFWRARVYNSIWRFAGFSELLRISAATLITGCFHTIGITLLFQRRAVTYYVVGMILQFGLTLMIRFSYRFILLERARREMASRKQNYMLIGAGAAGQMILKDVQKAQEINGRVLCIIDDNPNKWGRYIDGVLVIGGRDEIMTAVHRYRIDRILLAIPSAGAEVRRDILNICKESGCELKILPSVYQMVSGSLSMSQMVDVQVEDLLGRNPIRVNLDEIFTYIKGKTILVTGGGGSIGSELCRQIAGHEPGHLIIFDIYENNAYEIQQELLRKYPGLKLTVLIGSVRDSRRINMVFETYHPHIVYHAAAHKHVPLMEGSPNEAIKNNVIGTYKTAHAALMNRAERFVLISTDKAVNPTNIMGASKRLCEMVIQGMDMISKQNRPELLPFLHAHAEERTEDPMDQAAPGVRRSFVPQTEFVAVRFGNVLGSNGSVIPLFKKQIAAGGPVTVL